MWMVNGSWLVSLILAAGLVLVGVENAILNRQLIKCAKRTMVASIAVLDIKTGVVAVVDYDIKYDLEDHATFKYSPEPEKHTIAYVEIFIRNPESR